MRELSAPGLWCLSPRASGRPESFVCGMFWAHETSKPSGTDQLEEARGTEVSVPASGLGPFSSERGPVEKAPEKFFGLRQA